MGVVQSAVESLRTLVLAVALPLAALYLLSHLMARIYRTVGRKATVRLRRALLAVCSPLLFPASVQFPSWAAPRTLTALSPPAPAHQPPTTPQQLRLPTRL